MWRENWRELLARVVLGEGEESGKAEMDDEGEWKMCGGVME